MAVYRDIDNDTRINGKLTVSNVFTLGSIPDVESAINSRLDLSGGSITGSLTIGGDLSVTGDIIGINLNDYYTKTDMQTSGSAQVHWGNITGYTNPGYAVLGTSNTFTATGDAIKLRPQTNPSTTYTNEAVTFSSDIQQLANKPINSMSEVVKSDTSGTITYERDIDYAIDYKTGYITRKTDGSITAGATVYIDYMKTSYLFRIVNSTDTETKLGIDNEGNIHGKSISVLLSSSSESSEGETQGNFTVQGNMQVNGSATVGDDPLLDKLIVNGEINILNSLGETAIAFTPEGYIYIDGTRKDNLWDIAYTHSQDGSVHVTTTDKSNLALATNHANSTHAPADAPSSATFTAHTGDTDIHVTLAEKANWSNHLTLGETNTTAYRGDLGKAAHDHISSDGSSHTFIDQDVTTTGNPSFNTARADNGLITGNVTIKYNPTSKTLDFIFI